MATWEHGLYQALVRHSIVYRVTDKARGPQVFTFRLRLADPADLNKALSLSEQLALTMSVSSVRVARHLGLVDVEVALPRPFHRALSVGALQRKGKTWVTLGQTATGIPVHVNLAGNLNVSYNTRHASGRSAERPRDSASSNVASRRPLSWGSVPVDHSLGYDRFIRYLLITTPSHPIRACIANTCCY